MQKRGSFGAPEKRAGKTKGETISISKTKKREEKEGKKERGVEKRILEREKHVATEKRTRKKKKQGFETSRELE